MIPPINLPSEPPRDWQPSLNMNGQVFTPQALECLFAIMQKHGSVVIQNYDRPVPVAELGAYLATQALRQNNREWLRGFLLFAALMAVAMFVLLASTRAHAETRQYFPVAPSAMVKNHHTHVQVTGRVTISKREQDGDWHIRINDAQGFAVAECIPELPCAHPKIGQCVTVRGISRMDGEHKWAEIHPTEKLEVVPCRK